MALNDRNDDRLKPDGASDQQPAPEVEKFFKALIKVKGRDLHLEVGTAPRVLVRNSLKSLNRAPIYDDEMTRLCTGMMDEQCRRDFEETGEAKFLYFMPFEGQTWRFGVHVRTEAGHIGLFAAQL